MKCTYAKMHNTRIIRGIGQVIDLRPGRACSLTFGGGTIASMEIDKRIQSLVIRKAVPFKAIDETFDAVAIPLAQLVDYTIQDDEVVEPKGRARNEIRASTGD